MYVIIDKTTGAWLGITGDLTYKREEAAAYTHIEDAYDELEYVEYPELYKIGRITTR